MARSGSGVPLKVVFFTKLYCIMSPKTMRSPTCSGSANEYSPMMSPVMHVLPARM